ncbi:MAG: hypothetical protein P8X85_25960 [Desulfobacterales bacterium]
MKEVQSLLKIMSDGLKTLAQGVEALAVKVDEISKTQTKTPKKKKPTKAAAKAKTAKKPARRVTKKKEAKPMTALDTVFGVISRSKKGVDTATIMEKTGYNRKQVANYIYKLSKQGKIKSVERGVYTKV